MSELENKVIIYDDVCPMCKAYTAGFIKIGWLKHRTGFATAAPEILGQIDLDRARHEIPLLDTRTGEVVYGLNALFLILGERMPFLRPLFRNRFFRAILYQLYQIITYNRRIIAGSKAPATGFDCAPDVHLFYRWLYIGLASAIALGLLARYAFPLTPASSALLLLLILLLPAGLFIREKLDFAGHWATIALASALLASFLPQTAIVQAGVCGIVVLMAWKRWCRRQGTDGKVPTALAVEDTSHCTDGFSR